MTTPLSINWNTVSKQEFLQDYWQKKPIVLKNALPQLAQLTDENELAGLAMEDFIDSRIVEQDTQGKWQVSHGPFTDFSRWQDSKWSLLVQGVDLYLPEVKRLLSSVNFIPQWRIDDIMVSFSMPGAGVGLHLDQYDVFIVQGKGKRRWQAGAVDKSQCQAEVATDLLQLDQQASFSPIVDQVLENGDIIYIPPFSAHKGEAIEPAINYSIGFRAPNQQELMFYFADYLLEQNLGLERFQSTSVAASDDYLPQADINDMHELVLDALKDKNLFEQFCHAMYPKQD